MKSKLLYFVAMLMFSVSCCLTIPTNAQVVQTTDTYQWKRFETGGGGYFTGITFSPSTPGLMYVRSDVAPLHRYDAVNNKWINTGETFWPEKVTGRTGSIYGMLGSTGSAVHPTNDNIIFATYGALPFDNSSGVYKSTNKGQTWTQVLVAYMNSNESREQSNLSGPTTNERKCGNPMGIDPQNPSVMYIGTQQAGLYRSTGNGDNGTWIKIASIPNGTITGTKCVLVDKFSALTTDAPIRSSVIYASVYDDGVYRSTNGGTSFTKITGSPTRPQWMVQAPNGIIWVSNANNASGLTGGIWKYDGTTWSQIPVSAGIPANTSFLGLDVNPLDGNMIVAHRGGTSMTRSVDGGVSWQTIPQTEMTQSGDFDMTSEGFKVRSPFASASTIHFDPHTNGTIYMTDAFMVWKSTNALTAGTPTDKIVWEPLYKGLNNSIPFTMLAPPQAPSNTVAPLYAGGADGSNYRYDNVGGKPASYIANLPAGFANFNQYMSGLDFCETQPDLIWTAVNRNSTNNSDTRIGWIKGGAINSVSPWNTSLPYGANVQTGNTKISASASNPKNAFIVTGTNTSKVTLDGGLTWRDSRGLPGGIMTLSFVYNFRYPIESDRVNGDKFYAFHVQNNGEFYRSDDGGYNWKLVNTDIPALGGNEQSGSPLRVAAAPFMEGHVWVALGTNGLYKTINSGNTFTKVNYFAEARMVDFGVNKPNVNNPTVFVHGKHTFNTVSQWGVYRSIDMGNTWELITPLDEPLNHPLVIEADRKVFGRVYFGDDATGIKYGEMTNSVVAGTAPAAPSNLILTTQGAGIKLTWTDNSANETLFRIYRKKSIDTNFEPIGLAGFNTTSFVDSRTASNTNYDYYVEAYNEVGVNNSGNQSLTSPTAMIAPSNLLATAVAGRKASLTWQDNSNDEQGFIIEVAQPDSSFRELTRVSPNTTQLIHATAIQNIIYTYRVRGYKNDIFSAYTNEDTTIVINSSEAVLTLTAVSNNQINRTVAGNTLAFRTFTSAITSTQVGRAGNGVVACSIFPFAVPTLSSGTRITKVRFRARAEEVSTNFINVELYGLAARNTSTVNLTDYHDGNYTTTPAGTLLDGVFASNTATTLNSIVETKTATDALFKSFIETQNDNGNGVGKFFFLRLNQSTQASDNRISFDIIGDADNLSPEILITTVSGPPVSSITLNQNTVSLSTGFTAQLTTTVLPTDAFEQGVIWSSSNSAVATVDGNGLITGISSGTATITATSVNGGFTATALVTVTLAPPSNLLASAITGRKVSLTWQDNSPAEQGYIIEVSRPGDVPFRELARVSSNTTQFTHTNPELNIIYTYRVRAYKNTDFSTYSNTDTTIVVNTSESVITLTALSNNQINRTISGNTLAFRTFTSALTSTQVGRAGNGIVACSIFPFAIPMLSSNVQITKVRFKVRAEEVSTNAITVQLYGLPARNTSTVNLTDYHDGAFTTSPAGTLLDGVFASNTTTTLNSIVETKSSTDALFKSFIETQNDNGNGVGKFFFLRLNQSTQASDNRISFDIIGDADNLSPEVLVTTISSAPVSGITVNQSSVSLNLGATSQVLATVSPTNAFNQSVNWTSSNPTVATVDENGLITTITCGTTTITATSVDGGFTATTQVSVARNVVITSTPSTAELTCGTPITNITVSGASTYLWTGSGRFTASSASASISNAGTYTVIGTSSIGCIGSTSVVITENKVPPFVLVTPTSAELTCTAPTRNITASGANTYSWTSTGSFTAATASVNVSTTGTYTVRGTGSNGCTASVSVLITENKVTPTITLTPNSTVLTCTTPTTTITALGANTYSWTGTGGFTASTASVMVSNVGTYTVRGTNSNGCTALASVVITENRVTPTASITGLTTICNGANINLMASGGVAYQWSGPDSFTSTSSTIEIQNATLTNAGNYSGTVTSLNGCTATATVSISVNAQIPAPTVQADATIISGSSISLTATNCSGIIRWFNSSNDASVIMPVMPSATTTYYAKCEVSTNGLDCQSAKSGNVTVTVQEIDVMSIKSGDWEDGSTWNVGRAPLSNERAIIDNNHSITINSANAVAKKIQCKSNASLNFANPSAKLSLTGL
jgi:uncharacterized protein YjdB